MSRPLLPAVPAVATPMRGFGDLDGSVIQHIGPYARECVMTAYHMIGGTERLADWADRNPTEFYTRLFTKVITREVEVTAGSGIEELLAQLDRGGNSGGPTVDGEYEIADE